MNAICQLLSILCERNVLIPPSKTEEKEDIVYADIDLEKLKTIRDQVPITKQRRSEMYKVVSG